MTKLIPDSADPWELRNHGEYYGYSTHCGWTFCISRDPLCPFNWVVSVGFVGLGVPDDAEFLKVSPIIFREYENPGSALDAIAEAGFEVIV